jgi:peroxiredoxin
VCHIEGKITSLENTTVYAVFEGEENNLLVDTVTFHKAGLFKIKLKEENYRQLTLFFNDKSEWFTVYLDPRTRRIRITGDIRSTTPLQVKGGRINNDLDALRKEMEPLLKEEREIRKSIIESTPEASNELISRAAGVKARIEDHALSYIHKNTDNPVAAILIKTYFYDPEDNRCLDELLSLLSPSLKDFYLVRELDRQNARAKRTALGASAPGFILHSIHGDTLRLDSLLHKKYILLSFTAPWCDICRIADLHLDEIYRTHDSERLEQILISLDDNMQNARKSLKDDTIRWNLVADSAGQASALLNLYNVSSLPRCFLINPEGKIILKTENGVEVQQTLDKLLANH